LQLTAGSIHELFTSQSQSSVTYLQILMYFIYIICSSFFHKIIYTLYYGSTGVISLVINHKSMRFVSWHITIFSLSGRQLMSKTQALFNTKMQDVVVLPLEARICWLFSSKLSQALAAFIQCLVTLHTTSRQIKRYHTHTQTGRGHSLWNHCQYINQCKVRSYAMHSTMWLNNKIPYDLRYLVLFQSKHSCFWCSLISVSIGQHVSTFLFLGHHQVPSFFVCGSFSTFCNATYSRCLFYIWLKYIHMAKILVIILQYSYMVRYLFYLWLGFWYNTNWNKTKYLKSLYTHSGDKSIKIYKIP